MEKPTSKKVKLIVPLALFLLVVTVHYIVNMPPCGTSQDFKRVWGYSKELTDEKTIIYKLLKYKTVEVHFYCYPECRLYPGDKPIPEPFFSQEPFSFPRFTIEAEKIVVWTGIVIEGQSLDLRKPRIDPRDPFTDRVYRIDGSVMVDLNSGVGWKLRFIRKDHLVAVGKVLGGEPIGLGIIDLTPTVAPSNLES